MEDDVIGDEAVSNQRSLPFRLKDGSIRCPLPHLVRSHLSPEHAMY